MKKSGIVKNDNSNVDELDSKNEKNHVSEKIENLIEESIKNLPNNNDIYAFSLYMYANNDEPLQQIVVFGYNTEEQVKDSINSASSPIEARWNYAFWLQNSEFVFGEDTDTAKDIQEWLKEHNLINLPEDDEEWIIEEAFAKEMVTIVKDMHKKGIIKNKFGKELPILVHKLEYYDEIAKLNKEANGEYLPKEFLKFCKGEY